jgi:hypothetical protein
MKNLKISITILIVLIVVILGAFFYHQPKPLITSTPVVLNEDISDSADIVQPKTKVSSSTYPSKTIAPSAVSKSMDWNTYNDSVYHFAFKYPSNIPFHEGHEVTNTTFPYYEVAGPWGGGEYTSVFIMRDARGFILNSDSKPVDITGIKQIASLHEKIGLSSTYFKTNEGLDGVRVSNNSNHGFASFYLILKDDKIYEFQNWSKENDADMSEIAKTLSLKNIAPIVGRECGGGAMGNGGACPTGYSCKITKFGPPNEGYCVKN